MFDLGKKWKLTFRNGEVSVRRTVTETRRASGGRGRRDGGQALDEVPVERGSNNISCYKKTHKTQSHLRRSWRAPAHTLHCHFPISLRLSTNRNELVGEDGLQKGIIKCGVEIKRSGQIMRLMGASYQSKLHFFCYLLRYLFTVNFLLGLELKLSMWVIKL